MDPNYVQGLHSLLLQSTSNDTAQLQAATSQLNTDYYKNPACIPALAHILASSLEIAVRQLAAVELRKRVRQKSGDFWVQVPKESRAEIKSALPKLILAEPNKLVRHSAARVIAAIASIELKEGTWPELLSWLNEACTSPQVAQREVGVYILFTVLETVMEGFQDSTQNFFKLFQVLIVDPESIEVRVTTVRALGVLAQYIDTDEKADIKTFQAFLPAMIQVVQQALEAGDEAAARQLFDVFETLLILEIPLIGPHTEALASFLLICGANRNLDETLRILPLNALNWTVQYKKTKIQSQNLAGKFLEGLMPITTEPEPDDTDEDAPCRVLKSALRIIDGLATNLPPTQVFPALRTLIQQYFSSPDPNNRRGAVLALGVVVEGCSEFMTPVMSQVWPIIEAGLQDVDPSVRKATCIAVSCLCEWLEDECSAKHTTLIPAIMNLVHDPATQRSACTALDALLEILQDVIDQYLNLIMEQLANILDTAPISIKSVVTGAIGSAAHASKEKFLPYFQPTMNRLQHFLVLTGEGEESELRGIAMDAVGTFAEAVGPDVFRPYFADLMKQAFQGLEMGSPRLRECSFLFFSVMARVFGEEFAPYLPNVVPPLLASCRLPEHGEDTNITLSEETAAAFATGSSPTSAIAILDADTDGNIEAEMEHADVTKMLEVNSAIAVEKEIAADTIGALFHATRNHFFPYVEQCVLELVALLAHYYEGIRKSATESLLELVRVFYELSDPQEWQAGAAVTVPLQPSVKELIGHCVPPLLDMYESEDNKSVVSSLCTGLAETINKLGPAFIENNAEQICDIATQVLSQKALCQQDPDQDENEEAPEDQAEYDSVLISSAGDLVAAMANALGGDFAPAFATFFPLIGKYYKENRSLSDKSSAIGCLAEIISGMKSAVTPHTEPLFELFYRALGDNEAEVKSNACFAIGLLVEHSTLDLSPQYPIILAAIRPILDIPPGAPRPQLNASDNAVGAVARLIYRNYKVLPLDQVLPVFVGALPLKEDYIENRSVFRALFHLFRNTPQTLGPYLDALLPVFAYVLDPGTGQDQLGEEGRAELIELVRFLNTQEPAKVHATGLTVYL